MWMFIYLKTTGPKLLASGLNAYPLVCSQRPFLTVVIISTNHFGTAPKLAGKYQTQIAPLSLNTNPVISPIYAPNPSLQYRPQLFPIPCKSATVSEVHVHIPGESFLWTKIHLY